MKSLSAMTDAEFAAHHAAGTAQIQAFSAKLATFQRDVSSTKAKIAAWDAQYGHLIGR